jgi:quinol monooxygenase YgiN
VSYCIVATYRVKAGEEDAVQSALASMTPLSRNEPGCEFYRAHRSLEDSQVFFLYEAYRDEAAFQEHLASDYFGTYIRSGVWPLLEERARLIAAPIAGVDG